MIILQDRSLLLLALLVVLTYIRRMKKIVDKEEEVAHMLDAPDCKCYVYGLELLL